MNKLNHVWRWDERRLRQPPSVSKSRRIAIRGVGHWRASQGEDEGHFTLRRKKQKEGLQRNRDTTST